MVHRLKPKIFFSAGVKVTAKASADAPREILCERTDGTRSRTASLRLTYCDPGSRVDGKVRQSPLPRHDRVPTNSDETSVRYLASL